MAWHGCKFIQKKKKKKKKKKARGPPRDTKRKESDDKSPFDFALVVWSTALRVCLCRCLCLLVCARLSVCALSCIPWFGERGFVRKKGRWCLKQVTSCGPALFRMSQPCVACISCGSAATQKAWSQNTAQRPKGTCSCAPQLLAMGMQPPSQKNVYLVNK